MTKTEAMDTQVFVNKAAASGIIALTFQITNPLQKL
jgi:hypothetical protein